MVSRNFLVQRSRWSHESTANDRFRQEDSMKCRCLCHPLVQNNHTVAPKAQDHRSAILHHHRVCHPLEPSANVQIVVFRKSACQWYDELYACDLPNGLSRVALEVLASAKKILPSTGTQIACGRWHNASDVGRIRFFIPCFRMCWFAGFNFFPSPCHTLLGCPIY